MLWCCRCCGEWLRQVLSGQPIEARAPCSTLFAGRGPQGPPNHLCLLWLISGRCVPHVLSKLGFLMFVCLRLEACQAFLPLRSIYYLKGTFGLFIFLSRLSQQDQQGQGADWVIPSEQCMEIWRLNFAHISQVVFGCTPHGICFGSRLWQNLTLLICVTWIFWCGILMGTHRPRFIKLSNDYRRLMELIEKSEPELGECFWECCCVTCWSDDFSSSCFASICFADWNYDSFWFFRSASCWCLSCLDSKICGIRGPQSKRGGCAGRLQHVLFFSGSFGWVSGWRPSRVSSQTRARATPGHLATDQASSERWWNPVKVSKRAHAGLVLGSLHRFSSCQAWWRLAAAKAPQGMCWAHAEASRRSTWYEGFAGVCLFGLLCLFCAYLSEYLIFLANEYSSVASSVLLLDLAWLKGGGCFLLQEESPWVDMRAHIHLLDLSLLDISSTSKEGMNRIVYIATIRNFPFLRTCW